eukprot:6006649-Amphidinium_carterae.1
MQGCRCWASNVAEVVVASIAAKATANTRMLGAETCIDDTTCKVTCWDPGGRLRENLLGG